MPLPLIPVALWAGAAALAALGVKKGVDASNDLDKARRIGSEAEDDHKRALNNLDNARKKTQRALEALGALKVEAFTTQIKYLVDAIKKGRSKIDGFDQSITPDQLREYERHVQRSIEIQNGLASGAVGGALAAMGAYGSVGALATASTGAAISGLSGVAATNATLAWLGGGALSAGGFGMAGGMVALGGIVLGPALAIGGFLMASKAEEAVTEARRYEAKTEVAIAEIKKMGVGLKSIRSNAAEQHEIISRLVEAFEKVKVPDDSNPAAFKQMYIIGKSLKEILDVKIMNDDGQAVSGLKAQYTGHLEVAGLDAS